MQIEKKKRLQNTKNYLRTVDHFHSVSGKIQDQKHHYKIFFKFKNHGRPIGQPNPHP